MSGAYELLKTALRMHPDLIEAVVEVTDECRYCGYAEHACCCDQLCFWREQPCCPPCLEPKEDAADDGCKYHQDDYAADRAIHNFWSDPK